MYSPTRKWDRYSLHTGAAWTQQFTNNRNLYAREQQRYTKNKKSV